MSDFHDKTETADPPKVIQLEVSDTALRMIAELLPPITAWMESEGHEGQALPGDVILVALGHLHSQVYGKAHAILAAGREGPPVAH